MSSGIQTHDFDADINPFPNGLFWTIPIPRSSFSIDLEEARASLHIDNLSVPDYFNIPNALADGNAVPSTVSYDVRWRGVLSRITDRNPAQGYVGHFIYDTATVAWSAQEAGFSFVSNPANTSKSNFAAIGTERNGVFFDQGGDETEGD